MIHKIVRLIKLTAVGYKNLILRGTGESLKPRWLWFGVNDRCNNRCVFCGIWHNEPTKNPLTPKEIETVLKDPLFRGLEYILNCGGEPALRDDLEEIILIEHKVLPKARIQLSTNGSLPQRVIDVVKSAIKNDINIDVGVSLDAIGKKRDLVRGVKDSFEKVDRLLRELVVLREKHRDKLNIGVGMVLIDLTLSSLDEVKEYCKKLNVGLGIQWYSQAPYYNVCNVKKNPVVNSQSLIEAIHSQPLSFNHEMKLRSLAGKSIKFPCFAMYTFCVLQCTGDISPCFDFWDVKVGNVRESSPTTIWHSAEAKKVRKMIKDCKGCLNDCGLEWSSKSSFLMAFPFYIKHRLGLIKWNSEETVQENK